MARCTGLAVGCALALACGEGPVAPVQYEQVLPVLTQRSSASGASVVRGPSTYATVLADPSSGLSVVAGVTYQQLAEVCPTGSGLFTFDPGTFLNVRRADGSLKVLFKGKNVNVVVFAGVFPGDFCTGFSSMPPLATGTVNATFADNDFFLSRNRTDSFHERLTGTVVLVENGRRAHLTAMLKGLVAKDGTIRRLSTEIRLQ